LRVVLDTCILKLATFPSENNASAAIYELAHSGLIEAWVTPAILEEYSDVLGEHPELVAEVVESFLPCYPLTELSVIRHEPDNRFLEYALAAILERRSELGAEAYVFGSATGTYQPNIQTAWETLRLLAIGLEPRSGKEGGEWNREQLRRIDLRWHDLRHEGACRRWRTAWTSASSN
jgi:hypothetical protein